MRKVITAMLALACFLTLTSAQDKPPALPKVPAGFDEGRTELLREAADGLIAPDALVTRLFEDADLTELAQFCALHLKTDEKSRLDAALDRKGALSAARDAAAMEALFAAAKLPPADIATALGKTLKQQGYKLADVVAWLYLRGVNFVTLQRAMNGERIDSVRLRRQLRQWQAAGKGPEQLFAFAHWEFNLLDSREQKGGHYDGAQLIESLLALGWNEDSFARALKKAMRGELTAEQRALIRWGDATLIWAALAEHVAESELFKVVQDQIKADAQSGTGAAMLQSCLLRARTSDRWLRTGGPRVAGVWTGPLPNAAGEPKAPTKNALALENAGFAEFASGLDEDLRKHFADTARDALTIVGYTDGSVRMLITRPARAATVYAPDTPPGRDSVLQFYEGRFSLEGHIAFATLAFGQGQTIAPVELDLVNVRALAGGALLVLDIDNGVTLTPTLLRRTSRLIEAP